MKDKRKLLKYGLHIAVVAGIIWAIVKYVNPQEVLESLEQFKLIYIPIMIALALGSFFLKGIRFVEMISPFSDRVENKVIFKGYVAGQAIALLPGGLAARAGMMDQIGIPISESSAPVAFQSTYDQAVLLICSLIAALFFPAARTPIAIIIGVLVVVAALLIIPSTRNWLKGIAEKIAARFDKEDDLEHFFEAVPRIFTKKLIAIALGISIVAFGLQFGILWLAMDGMGLDVPLPTLFLAFVLPTMLGRIVPVPGGFGVTEAGMVGFLSSTTDINSNTAVAAVALFRIAAVLVPAAVGAIVYFLSWKGEKEEAEEESSEEPPESSTVKKAVT